VLIIVRHGRTAANASGVLLGRLDPSLDDEGRRQAAAVATTLGTGGARVVSSPLRRAQETAAMLSTNVEVDDRWIEMDYGSLDGTPIADVPLALWQRWQNDVHFAPEGGESLAAMGERVRAACTDVAGDAVDRDVIVVTHVSPMKAAVAWAVDAGDDLAWRLYVAPGAITRIGIGDLGGARRAVLRSFNETAHLR
jgi:broad specificity phosphatase PhoE